MRKNLIYLLLPLLFASCGKRSFQVTPEFDIVTENVKFSSNLTLIYNSEQPDLKMSPAGIKKVNYNVATWSAYAKDADVLVQAERNLIQQGDGFDDSILSKKAGDRTANLFDAGENIEIVATEMRENGDTINLYYAPNDYAQVVAKVYEERGELCFKIEMQTKTQGYFSVAFMNAPHATIEEAEEIWQPMIWQEKRFPDRSYMTLAYRCPIPSAFTTIAGTTTGILAHPDEFGFDPLPVCENSRFGVAVRNNNDEAQAMLFAPVLGGIESKMEANEAYQFTAILYAQEGNCIDTYRDIAITQFNFKDYRRNDIATLNEAFENINAYAMTEYAWFVDSLKGCAYSTDVPGSVKNVSSLNPLELAIVTDNEEMFTKRAYPTMEFQLSREKTLFCLDKEQMIQSPSRKMQGPCALISELTSLYNIFDKNMPFLKEFAENSYFKNRPHDFDISKMGNTWMSSLFMYKATGEQKYLDKAVKDADDYLANRIDTHQTGFTDPLAGGFFFWTGFSPRWIYLLELYELTKEQRYLDAAQQGARYFTMYCWMSPQIPNDSILVNKGGKAPIYWYLESKGHHQMYCDEELAPAWRLSEIGLTPESSGTSTGHRAIFMANFAPWMMRVGYYANDEYLRDVAKASTVGRYRNFPGYHINTARTTIYEKADYPLRKHLDLSVNSFHYNHIMPMASMLLDYMVTDAFVKSDSQIDFPSEFIEGYAYLQNKFYGHKAGSWYGDEAWLWMPPKLIETGSVELNYITARGTDNKLYIALSNQSPEVVKTWVKINTDLVTLQPSWSVKQLDGKGAKVKDGAILVEVPAHGQVALTVAGAVTVTKFQHKLIERSTAWENDFITTKVGNANAMIISCGEGVQNLYIYLEDDDDMLRQAELRVKTNSSVKSYIDKSYPYEFTVPVTQEAITFQLCTTDTKGKKKESNWKTLNK